MSRLDKDVSALKRSATGWAATAEAGSAGATGWAARLLGTWLLGTWLLGTWLLGTLACLPSEDLSSYSSGNPRLAPGAVIGDSVLGDSALGQGEARASDPPAPALPGSAPLVSGECNADCALTELPLLSDAGSADPGESGGSVAPGELPQSDAGVAPAQADAGAAVGPCGQGALLAPDDRCFALVTPPGAWDVARAACVARGAGWDLAVIRSEERNDWLAGMLGGALDAWVGANDLAQEGSWRWVGDTSAFFTGTGTTGSAAAGAYVSWNTGGTPEPNGGAASDCLRLRASGGWADIACSSAFAALCEGPQP